VAVFAGSREGERWSCGGVPQGARGEIGVAIVEYAVWWRKRKDGEKLERDLTERKGEAPARIAVFEVEVGGRVSGLVTEWDGGVVYADRCKLSRRWHRRRRDVLVVRPVRDRRIPFPGSSDPATACSG
jgi:hypothetical protein